MTPKDRQRLRIFQAELAIIQAWVSEILDDEPATDEVKPTPRRRNAKIHYSTMRKFPKGLLRPGMTGDCKGVKFILDDELRLKVTTGNLKGETFDSPSEMALAMFGAVRNGFNLMSLEGRRLSDIREQWMAA